jgi:anti-sigma B factor antagonist
MQADQGIPGDVRTGELEVERTDAGLAVLTITGEHDLSTAPDLRRRLETLLNEAPGVIVDLSTATFIDSSILGTILDAKRRAGDAAVGYAVLHSKNGTSAVDRLLEVTGLRTELPVHEERESAVFAAGGATEAVE